jgi:hypothetical protein
MDGKKKKKRADADLGGGGGADSFGSGVGADDAMQADDHYNKQRQPNKLAMHGIFFWSLSV